MIEERCHCRKRRVLASYEETKPGVTIAPMAHVRCSGDVGVETGEYPLTMVGGSATCIRLSCRLLGRSRSSRYAGTRQPF